MRNELFTLTREELEEFVKFNYKKESEDKITEHIILANQIFNLNTMLSDDITKFISSFTVLTNTQRVSVPFDDLDREIYHWNVGNEILKRIYPDYNEKRIIEVNRVDEERKRNVYIYTMKTLNALMCFFPNEFKLTRSTI